MNHIYQRHTMHHKTCACLSRLGLGLKAREKVKGLLVSFSVCNIIMGYIVCVGSGFVCVCGFQVRLVRL